MQIQRVKYYFLRINKEFKKIFSFDILLFFFQVEISANSQKYEKENKFRSIFLLKYILLFY